MSADASIDGFYTAFVTGSHGQAIVLFVFRGGLAVGADMGGCIYDGTYVKAEDSQSITLSLTVKQPGGITTVQGETLPSEGRQFDIQFSVPLDTVLPYFRVDTPHGSVNARLQKIRGL